MRLRSVVVMLGGTLFVYSAATAQTSSNAAPADRVCGSAAARVAVQEMEAEITKDPVGKQAQAVADSFGMKAETGEGQLIKLESINGDRAYPGKTPDSFLCQGKFVHRKTGLTPQDEKLTPPRK